MADTQGRLASSGRWSLAGRVARLRPLTALLIVIALLAAVRLPDLVAFLLYGPEAVPVHPFVTVAVGMPFFMLAMLGYPFLVSSYLRKRFGPLTGYQPSRTMTALALLMVSIAIFFSDIVLAVLSREARSPSPLVLLATVVGLVSVLYILWSAARALVYAEEGRVVPAKRVKSTFFMFYFLPFYVWFLQRRVRRLAVGGTSERTEA